MSSEVSAPACLDLAQWLTHLERQRPASRIKLGLSRLAPLVQRWALQKPAPLVIVVVGTNGKGSTVCLLEALLLAQGRSVGAYTSPHLLSFNERVRINGRSIDDASLVAAFNRIARENSETLTYFEWVTLAALLIFKQHDLDMVILEAGMGGRLDAVNVVDADFCLVTSIGLDHTEWLGDTREAIAQEKAGVFRAHQAVFCGDPSPPNSLMACADTVGAVWHCLGRDYNLYCHDDVVELTIDGRLHALPKVAGFHPHNVANAVACFLSLPSVAKLPNFNHVLSQLNLPGRCQRLPGRANIWLDVCHNEQSLMFLLATIQRYKTRKIAIFSALQDKPVSSMFRLAATTFDEWHLAPLPLPRGLSGASIAQMAESCLSSPWYCYPAIEQAFERLVSNTEDMIVIFGSFHCVAAFLRWQQRAKV